MILGGVRVVSYERLHSTLHGTREVNPSIVHPGSVSAHRPVADGGLHEVFGSPSPRDTVQSATEAANALQRPFLSLRREGGVQVWRSRDMPVSAEVLPFRTQIISEISEAAGAAEEQGPGEEQGISGSTEADGKGINGLFSEAFKFDPFGEIKYLGRQAAILKEEVMSLDYKVEPTPFTPVEGVEAFRFGAICLLLVFVFWLGNYYVPDIIFKNTVYRKDAQDPFEDAKLDEEPSDGSSENKTSDREGGSSAIKSGLGFSQSRKQSRRKSAKRK